MNVSNHTGARELESLTGKGTSESKQILDQLIRKAIKARADTLHILPEKTSVIVKFRIDGAMQHHTELSKHLHASLSNVLKRRALLESYSPKPQEGSFAATYFKVPYHFSLIASPSLHGEKIVLHIAQQDTSSSLETLGFWGKNLITLQELVVQPRGLILITGGASTGGTQTLRAIQELLKHPSVSIASIQSNAEKSILPTHAALQLALAQRPHVITLAHINDADTLQLALHAAERHLVIGVLPALTPSLILQRARHWSGEAIMELPRLLLGIVSQQLMPLMTPLEKTLKKLTAPQLKKMQQLYPNLTHDIASFRSSYGLAGGTNITPMTVTQSGKKQTTIGTITANNVMASSTTLQRILVNGANPIELKSYLDTHSTLSPDILVKAAAGVIDWKYAQKQLA